MTTRRDFALGAGSAGLSAALAPPVLAADHHIRTDGWDQGKLLHLLPTVSHDRILVKASFSAALAGAPELHVGEARTRGRKNSAVGDFWQFDVPGLKPPDPLSPCPDRRRWPRAVRALVAFDLPRAGCHAVAAASADLYLRRRP